MADETDSELCFPKVSTVRILNRHHHNAHPSTGSVLFDMRQNNDCEKGLVLAFSDQRHIADMWNSPLDHIVDGPQHCRIDDRPVKILTADRNKRKFLIKFHANAYCVRIQENTTVRSLEASMRRVILNFVKEYQNEEAMFQNRKSVPAVYDLVLKCLKSDCGMAVVYNSRQLSVSETLHLPDWAVVELVLDVPLSWRITYRHSVFCDKTYLVRCKSNDSLASVKRKFLKLWKTGHNTEKPGPSVECVWFVQRDKVVTEALVKQNVESILSKVSNRDGVRAIHDYHEMIEQENEIIRVRRNTKPCLTLSRVQNDICIDDVFVYFVPPDAARAQVVMKAYDTETNIGCVMVSPQQTVDAVREEIAKLVRRETNSISVSLRCVELDSKVNLHQALSGTDIKFTVTAKNKISLFADVGLGDELRQYAVQVYSHEKVEVLKARLCEWSHVGEHTLDLFFDGRQLTDGSWSEHRICDGDHLKASLYPRRQTVWVRLPTRRWCLLQVDDGETTMVADLMAFCRTLGDADVGGSPLTAIVGDTAVCDTDVVADLSWGVTQTPRLVLVQADNPCFTEDTAYRGTHIVYCQNQDGAWFDALLSKYSQEFKHHGPVVEKDKVDELLEKRRTAAPEHRPVTGIRLARHQTQPQLPEHTSALRKHAATQTDVTSLTSNSISVSTDTSYLKTKRSSVHFHTGNSCSDLDARSDGEDQDESLDDRDVESVDEEDTAGVGEMPHDGYGDRLNPSEALTAKDFTMADEQEDFCDDKRKARVSQPGAIQRSKSCPRLNRTQKSLSFEDGSRKRYDSDTGDMRELTRRMILEERCLENPDGTWILKQTMTSQAQLTPEHIQQHLSSLTLLPQQSALVSIKDSQGNLLQAEQPQGLSAMNPTYRNIKANIIRWLAKNLGRDGLMVMRELGVSDETIEEAEAAHPQHLSEKYLYCLRAWLKQTGCEASMDALKQALGSCRRRDLVRSLEEQTENPAHAPETTDSEDGTGSEAKK